MFKQGLTIGLFVAGVAIGGMVHAHSEAFEDDKKYDPSDEGLLPLAGALFNQANEAAACVNGLAGIYPCRNIDLEARLVPAELGGGSGELNDIWGWTDPDTGAEIAIVGRINGTSFVDVSDSQNPVLLGFLPSHDGQDFWRDVKVYQDHAFIVADKDGNRSHGLQIYDLRQLAGVTPGATLTETAHYDGFGHAHNIAINEESGFAFIVGSNQCRGGLYMVNVATPTSPSFAGCFSDDGYTHDAQCVIYRGPDARFLNREICVAFNEDTLTIVDVTDKSNPTQLSRTPYRDASYTHQGWFLDDNHTYLILGDENDETEKEVKTTSYLFDVSLLDAPTWIGNHVAETEAVDHNLYTKDGLIYQTNYRAGLRVLGTADIESGTLNELGYFDTIPCSNTAQFSGAWSSYIYFASGTVVVSDIGSGLFVLRPRQQDIIADADDFPSVTSPACESVPVANAGTDVVVEPGANVNLDASDSSGPNGEPISFDWVEISDSGIVLNNANTAAPDFVAPADPTTVIFRLTVATSGGANAIDIVSVIVNAPPSADAGPNQSVEAGDTVTLNGSGSSDLEGDPLAYAWAEVSRNGVVLNNAGVANPSFVAPATETTVTLRLTVTDDNGATDTDTVDIVVNPASGGSVSSALQPFSLVLLLLGIATRRLMYR